MLISRRNFILGALAAPAIIRTPGLLMPVKAIEPIKFDMEVLPPGLYEFQVQTVKLLCERKLWFEFGAAGSGKRVTQTISI
jgi:hypothetical protein